MLQHTENGLPKLVLTKHIVTYNENYNALPYNYKNSPNIKGIAPVFQTRIDGLTWSGRCFTPEELERQRKAKDKEVVNAIKYMEINKLKVMKKLVNSQNWWSIMSIVW